MLDSDIVASVTVVAAPETAPRRFGHFGDLFFGGWDIGVEVHNVLTSKHVATIRTAEHKVLPRLPMCKSQASR